MNTYEFPMPRAAFALAALAMSMLTIGVLVVLPSRMESDSQAYALFAASRATQCATAVPVKCANLQDLQETAARAPSQRVQESRCIAEG